MRCLLLLCLAIAATASTAAPAPPPGPDLAAYLGTHRILLVFAPGEADRDLERQRTGFMVSKHDMDERDLVLLAVTGSSPADQALRTRYAAAGPGFAALLIGKDGGVKLRSEHPIPPGTLAALIDTMPMRQSERRQR